MEAARQFKVIVLRTRTAAQRSEVEPNHAIGFAQCLQLTLLNAQDRAFVRYGCELREVGAQGLIGGGAQGRVVCGHLRKCPLTIIRTGVDIDHIELRLDQLNSWQQTVPM